VQALGKFEDAGFVRNREQGVQGGLSGRV
jgi:hypothetical protein